MLSIFSIALFLFQEGEAPLREALLLPLEGERGGVDAIAQPRGARPVRENMPQVAAAVGAGDFHPPHSQARVFVLRDSLRLRGQHEAGPAAA